MGRRLLIYVSAAVLIAALILPIQGLAGSDDDPDPQNKLLLDIVFNKESGEMDAG